MDLFFEGRKKKEINTYILVKGWQLFLHLILAVKLNLIEVEMLNLLVSNFLECGLSCIPIY